MGDAAGKTAVGNGSHNGRVIQFLSLIYFVSTGITARMVMAYELRVRLDGANNVAFHDLRVVDVIQYLDVR